MKPASHFFTEAEMKGLLKKLRQSARHGRLIDRIDHALVTFAWATGCRASEIASMSLSPSDANWIDLKSGLVTITDAKWDSKGTIPLDVASLRVIRHYVREIRPQIRNAAVLHCLFVTKTGRPYTSNKLSKKLTLLLRRYGLNDKTAHSFRHFFCTDLFKRGARLHEAKALMRHRDVRSTMVYSHSTTDDLRAVVNRRLG